MPTTGRRRLAYLAWAILVFLVLFWRLGEPTFWDPDEAHYAQTTRELMTSGDWMTPTYNGQPYFDKPVFFHHLQALAMFAAGPNELGARLVSAVAGVALLTVTWWLGATLYTGDVGLVAALLLTTCPAMFALARYAILDLVFTTFLVAGAALVAVAALRRRPGLQYGGYVLIGLAVMIKGPVALVLCGLAFSLAILVSAEARRALLGLHWIGGLMVAVALSAPWFVYMFLLHDEAFVKGYVLNENLWLFAKPVYRNQPGWTFYPRIVALGFLPWTPVLIGRLYDTMAAAVRREQTIDAADTVLWSWVVGIMAFFSVSHFKLDHYVFPVAPALYLLCAQSLSIAQRGTDRRQHVGVRVGLLGVGPILIAAGGVSTFVLVKHLALPPGAFALPVAMIISGVWLTRSSSVRSGRAPWIASAALGIMYAVAVAWVVPTIERQKVMDRVARWVAEAADRDRVCSYRLNRWNNSLRFYVQRHVTMLDSPDDMRRFMAEGDRFHCVMPESAYEELKDHGMHLQIRYEENGLWATSGRALRPGRGVPTRFLVVSHPGEP